MQQNLQNIVFSEPQYKVERLIIVRVALRLLLPLIVTDVATERIALIS